MDARWHVEKAKRITEEQVLVQAASEAEPDNCVFPVYATHCGKLVMIRHGRYRNGFIAHFRMPGCWLMPTESPFIQDDFEWRETAFDAQQDLDAYAKKRGWTRMRVAR